MKLFYSSLLLLGLFLGNTLKTNACCPDDPYSATELIMSQRDKRDIFIVRLDPNDSMEKNRPSISAEVIKVIKGQPKATKVVLHQLYHYQKGEDFLVVANSSDGINYHLDPCDQYTRSLAFINKGISPNVIEIMEEYMQLVKQNHTGMVSIKGSKNTLARGKMKNGKPEGSWTHYFPRTEESKPSIIKSVTPYKNGLPHGKESLYGAYKNFPLSGEYFYNHGKVEKINYYQAHTGQSVLLYSQHFIQEDNLETTKTFTFQKDGKKIEVISEIKLPHSISSGHWNIQKIKHGLYQDYYYNGQLKSIGKYFWGAQVGIWTFYNYKGETEKTEQYPTPNRPKKLFTIYHHNGLKRLQGLIKNNRLEKTWKKYNSAGTLIAYANFKDNKIEGIFENFFPDGTSLYYSQKYTNGLKNGAMVLYHQDKKTIAKTGQFVKGKPEGEFLEYYADGTLKSKKSYVDGVYHGTNESYFKTGILHIKSNHKKGLLHGEYLRNKKDGSVKNVIQYFENKITEDVQKSLSN